MNKAESLESIMADIFALNSPKIKDKRKEKLKDFIVSTVNGDKPVAHLAVDIGDTKDSSVCYILTNQRIIKLDIDKSNIQVRNFWLNNFISSERKLENNDTEQFNLFFENGAFGLEYATEKNNITHFFQTVEQSRRGENEESAAH